MANKVTVSVLLAFVLSIFSLYAQGYTIYPKDVSEEEKSKICSFLYSILRNDKETVAKQIIYPIRFDFPISQQIHNEKEFIEQYDRLFPLEVKKKLLSDFDIQKNPMVVDGDGVFIEGVLVASFRSQELEYYYIYTSEDELEKARRAYALNFHSSVEFDLVHPIGFIKTNRYQILVDYNPSTDSYRYSCWKTGFSTTSKPDIIIKNGGGGVYKGGRFPLEEYVFKNGEYTYSVSLSLFGASLSVSKNGEKILLQEAEEVEGFKMSGYFQMM